MPFSLDFTSHVRVEMEILKVFSICKSWPPSLSQMGNLREGQKADLVKCLKTIITPEADQPTLDTIILNGAIIVQMLPPGTVRTFEEYCIYPCIMRTYFP